VFFHDAVILPVRPVEDVEHISGDRQRPQGRVDDEVPDNPDGGRGGQLQPPRCGEGVQANGAGRSVPDYGDQSQHGIEAEFDAEQAEPGIQQAGEGVQRGQFLANGAPMRQHHGADFLVCPFPGHLSLPAKPEELAAIASARKAC